MTQETIAIERKLAADTLDMLEYFAKPVCQFCKCYGMHADGCALKGLIGEYEKLLKNPLTSSGKVVA